MSTSRSESTLTSVVDAISILMSWRTVGSFRARVFHQLGADAAREYALRIEFNEIRPREHLSWHRSLDVHFGYADPAILILPNLKSFQLFDAGQTSAMKVTPPM